VVEVEPPIASSSELGISSEPEYEGGWGKKMRLKLMSNVCAVQVCFTTAKNRFDTKMSQGSTYRVRTVGMGFVCGRYKK